MANHSNPLTRVALLRGINVGGRNKLPMAELRALCADIGFVGTRTYIQSGNVVFTADQAPAVAADTLRLAILDRFGLTVPVVVRRPDELIEARAASPYAEHDPKFVHIVFLSDIPQASRVAALDPERSPPGVFEVIGAEMHIHYLGGSGRSKITLPWIERELGVTGTGRNLRTIDKLIAMCS